MHGRVIHYPGVAQGRPARGGKGLSPIDSAPGKPTITASPLHMNLRPLRLPPGTDLRRELEAAIARDAGSAAFVLSGIGSLVHARLRLADAAAETTLSGPLEILTIAGSLTADGAHLHVSVADRDGRVYGGHLVYGSEIRTTAEVLLAELPGWQLSREFDAATGYPELVVRRKPE